MAHGLEKETDMAYVGRTPWHGLGNKLTPNSPLDVWCKESGMDFEIHEAASLYYDGNAVNPFPDRKVLFRHDTLTPLSIVSDSYNIVQPNQILEFYRDLVAAGGFSLETAGVLFGGKKFWALAKANEEARVMGQDKMLAYLLLATSCDGSLATTAKFTNVCVVCNNTLTLANYVGGAVKVPHNTHFHPEIVKDQLGLFGNTWASHVEDVNKIAKVKITDAEALEFIRNLVGDDEKELHEQNETFNTIVKLYGGAGMGSKLKSRAHTAWGAVNAVTEFVDHHYNAKVADTRFDRAMFGPGNNLKTKAFEAALALVA